MAYPRPILLAQVGQVKDKMRVVLITLLHAAQCGQCVRIRGGGHGRFSYLQIVHLLPESQVDGGHFFHPVRGRGKE